MEAWVSVVAPEKVLPSVVDFLVSPRASAEGKVTILHWLKALLEARKLDQCLDQPLKAAAVVGVDKAVEVREAAGQLAAALVEVRSNFRPSSAYPVSLTEHIVLSGSADQTVTTGIVLLAFLLQKDLGSQHIL